MNTEQLEPRNIVFFDTMSGKKDCYCQVPLSLELQHEGGVEYFLPEMIEEICVASGIEVGAFCNLRFYDLKARKKLCVSDVSKLLSGDLSDATDKEIENCKEKLSKL